MRGLHTMMMLLLLTLPIRKLSLLQIEGLILGASLLVAWYVPLLGAGILRPIEKIGAPFAARKSLVILAIAVAAIVVRISMLWLTPVPVPAAHDEFSYLLAADTFAHGRLTNPPHPMWIFLDTIHVNQHPTYMSKYPPAQGAVLAIGMLLGHPWIGVLLSMAGMCAAITWMLQGWFPAEWAVLGGALVLVQFSVFNYWVDSYWGGAVAAIGGALVMGSLPRIFQHQRPRDAIWLGLGAAILANSRPFEGFVFCLPVAAALGWWLLKPSCCSWRVTFPRVILPLSSV